MEKALHRRIKKYMVVGVECQYQRRSAFIEWEFIFNSVIEEGTTITVETPAVIV